MGEITDKENDWLAKATEAAIAGARKVALNSTSLPMKTPVGRLSDVQWGWIVTGAIFAWVRTRVEQGDRRRPRSGAGRAHYRALAIAAVTSRVVRSILPTLADTAGDRLVTAADRLVERHHDELFAVGLAAAQQGGSARDHGPGKIIGEKSKDWATKGENRDIPFDRLRGS